MAFDAPQLNYDQLVALASLATIRDLRNIPPVPMVPGPQPEPGVATYDPANAQITLHELMAPQIHAPQAGAASAQLRAGAKIAPYPPTSPHPDSMRALDLSFPYPPDLAAAATSSMSQAGLPMANPPAVQRPTATPTPPGVGQLAAPQDEVYTSEPATPEEVEARKKRWTDVFKTIQMSPELSMALIRAGTSLMQPMPMWQTPAGHFGRAVDAGLDQLQEQQRQEVNRRQVEAQTRATSASAEQTELENRDLMPTKAKQETARLEAMIQGLEEGKDLAPLKKKQLIAEIARLEGIGALQAEQAAKIRAEIEEIKELTPAKKRQMLARAYYSEQMPHRPTGGSSSAAAVRFQLYKERAEQYVAQGMPRLEAEMKAWDETNLSASATKDRIATETAQKQLEGYYAQYQDAKAAGRFKKGSFQEFVESKAALDLDKDVVSRLKALAPEFEASKTRQQNTAGQQAQPGQAGNFDGRAAPVPYTQFLNPNGRGYDIKKLKPGVPIMMHDGVVRQWDGQGSFIEVK